MRLQICKEATGVDPRGVIDCLLEKPQSKWLQASERSFKLRCYGV